MSHRDVVRHYAITDKEFDSNAVVLFECDVLSGNFFFDGPEVMPLWAKSLPMRVKAIADFLSPSLKSAVESSRSRMALLKEKEKDIALLEYEFYETHYKLYNGEDEKIEKVKGQRDKIFTRWKESVDSFYKKHGDELMGLADRLDNVVVECADGVGIGNL
jgi:hypothetical protein